MTDRVGQRFGDYRLTSFIGRGGFGDVYLGQHVTNNTLVAIKLMETKLDADDLKLFIQETSTIFRMKHPRIVQMLDFGISSDGIPFLAMAYAPNGTLRQRHPKGSQLPLATIVPYVTPIADALQFVHDQKRVHCDVKPENILLGPNNELWLSDFGISIISRTSSMRSPSSITGTACYMAPEQFRGRPEPASDQYALAVMVYEWLSGTPPFAQGDFIQLGYQHAHEPVPPLRGKVATIPIDVEQAIMTALAKEAALRFGSVKAFAYALEQAATRTEVVVPPNISFSYPSPPVRIVPQPAPVKTSIESSYAGPSVPYRQPAPPPAPVRRSIEDPAMVYQHDTPAITVQTQQPASVSPGLAQTGVNRPHPPGVTVVAIVILIYDILCLNTGITNMDIHQYLLGVMLLVCGIITAIAIYGLWRLRRWGYWATIISMILLLLPGIIMLIIFNVILTLAISLPILIYLLTSKKARAAFRK